MRDVPLLLLFLATATAESTDLMTCMADSARAVPASLGLQLLPAAHPANPRGVDLVIAPASLCAQLSPNGICDTSTSIAGSDGEARYVVGTSASLNMEAAEQLSCAAKVAPASFSVTISLRAPAAFALAQLSAGSSMLTMLTNIVPFLFLRSVALQQGVSAGLSMELAEAATVTPTRSSGARRGAARSAGVGGTSTATDTAAQSMVTSMLEGVRK